MDPRRTPAWVRAMHCQAQVTKLDVDRWPPRASRATLPPPVQTKPAAVPPDHRRRPEEDERLAPSGPAARQPRSEDSVGGPESNSTPRALALEYEKLMAKSDPLRMERGSAPKETQECAEKGQEGRRQHRCRLIARRKHQHCQPGSGFREPHGSSRRWTLTSRVRPAPGVHLGLQGAPRNSP